MCVVRQVLRIVFGRPRYHLLCKTSLHPNFLPTEIRFVRWPRIRFHPEHSTIPQQIGRNGELAGGTVGPECGEFLFLNCCWLSYRVTNVWSVQRLPLRTMTADDLGRAEQHGTVRANCTMGLQHIFCYCFNLDGDGYSRWVAKQGEWIYWWEQVGWFVIGINGCKLIHVCKLESQSDNVTW